MKKQDGILIGAVILVILLAFGLLPLFQAEGAYVVIRLDGQPVAQYDLTVNAEYELNGGTHVLRIEDGSAFLLSADCPDHLCVNQGKIDRSGETITCLPHRLTVTVYGGEKGDVELVS